ncbi:hypothetical protein BDZ89DRAFT_1155966 [Hymenopellis radicata]|nr:hypothetical protein BDZ89DRAFT_1155966 [Hymenopellis radicata]
MNVSPLSRPLPTSPSTPPARTRAAKAEGAIAFWENMTRDVYEKKAFQAQVEAAEWPTVVCYNATISSEQLTRSSPLSRDSEFFPVIRLVGIVGRLLLTLDTVRHRFLMPMTTLHLKSAEAHAQFDDLHPDKACPNDDQILAFVTKNFPNVIILQDTAKKSRLTRAVVNKAEEEGADKNEMFISKDLAQTYLDTQANRRPVTVTEIQYAKVKRSVEFVLIATILHELGHCLTKHLFVPQFLTPHLPAHLVGSETRGAQHLGEVGQDIEMGILGCIAVFEWTEPASFHSSAERLWHIDSVLGWVKGINVADQWYRLTDAQIDHVIQMVHHGFICQMPFEDQKDIGACFGHAIRAKPVVDGMNVLVQQEVIEDSLSGLDSNKGLEVFPGLGLQITLNPSAIRLIPSGDRRF